MNGDGFGDIAIGALTADADGDANGSGGGGNTAAAAAALVIKAWARARPSAPLAADRERRRRVARGERTAEHPRLLAAAVEAHPVAEADRRLKDGARQP